MTTVKTEAKTKARPISQAPHVIASSYVNVSREMLPHALYVLDQVGSFLRSVTMEAVSYRVEFCHPEFEGRETQLLFERDAGRGRFIVSIDDLGPARGDAPSSKGLMDD